MLKSNTFFKERLFTIYDHINEKRITRLHGPKDQNIEITVTIGFELNLNVKISLF